MTAAQRQRVREEIDRAKRNEMFTTDARGAQVPRHKNYDQNTVAGIKHGTTGYKDHRCRCDVCRAAVAAHPSWHRRRYKKEASA